MSDLPIMGTASISWGLCIRHITIAFRTGSSWDLDQEQSIWHCLSAFELNWAVTKCAVLRGAVTVVRVILDSIVICTFTHW